MPPNTSPRLKLWRAALLGATLASLTPDGRAVAITWDQVSNISAESDVIKDGTLVGAWTLRNSNTGPQGSGLSAPFTLNTVTFTNVTNTAGSGNLAISVGGGGSITKVELNSSQQTNSSVTGSPYSQLTAPYKALTMGTMAVVQQGVNRPMTLTISGLTASTTYSVQLWTSWPLGFLGGTKFTVTNSFGEAITSPVLDSNMTNTTGGVGQFVTGTFTTGPSETQIAIVASSNELSPAGGNAWLNVNALQVRQVHKTAWFKNAKYGIGANWNAYPQGLTGTVSGPEQIAMNNFVNKKVANGNMSDWAKQNEDFDVTGFVQQVELTGAGYVIFGVGGSTGLYSSPNSVFETTQVGNHGPYSPGEWTPPNDLILRLANALNAKGIKLIVYIASEGPMRQFYIQRSPTDFIMYPSVSTHAGDGNPDKPAYSAAFRTTFNSMLNEWSTRWKSKVAGWWFDGVFPKSGYRETGWPGDPTVNDPVANQNALIAAAKAGNPQSLVALNPLYEHFNALSENQDYTAGETGGYTDTRGKFYEYPYTQFRTFGTNTQIQNHYYSFLGTWWNDPQRKYVDEEIINYVSSVNKVGGVVTLAVGVSAGGVIPDNQMAQLERLKAALKPSVAPATAPQPIASFTNLALYKPAWLMRHGWNYGDPHLIPGVGYQKQPHAGVDGDSSTYAMPTTADSIGNTVGYSYIVDLEASKTFDRVAVTFAADRFSTSYKIEYSPTGLAGTWLPIDDVQTTYSNSTAGLKIHGSSVGGVPTPVSGQFLRLSSSLPNWVNQLGYMMGVQEFGVFNIAGTLQSTKETIWVDEEFPTGATVTTAGAATWQTASTLDTTPVSWSSLEAAGVPFPLNGIKLHWNKLASGHNEHGFTGSSEPLRVSSGDSVYCDVYLDPANPTTEILLTFKDASGVAGTARWGADSIPGSGNYVGAIPTPSPADQWVRLSVPASTAGIAGKTLTGMSFGTYGGRTFFDRVGKITP